MTAKHRRLNASKEMQVRQYETHDGVRYAVLDTGLLTAFAVSEALMIGGGHVAVIRESGGCPRDCHRKMRDTLDQLKNQHAALRTEIRRRQGDRPAFGAVPEGEAIPATLGAPEGA